MCFVAAGVSLDIVHGVQVVVVCGKEVCAVRVDEHLLLNRTQAPIEYVKLNGSLRSPTEWAFIPKMEYSQGLPSKWTDPESTCGTCLLFGASGVPQESSSPLISAAQAVGVRPGASLSCFQTTTVRIRLRSLCQERRMTGIGLTKMIQLVTVIDENVA